MAFVDFISRSRASCFRAGTGPPDDPGPPNPGTANSLSRPRTRPGGNGGFHAPSPPDPVRGPDENSSARPAPRLTPCIPNRPGTDLISLTQRRLAWSLALVAFVLSLGLVRVHLRFSAMEMRTQHSRLQKMKRDLHQRLLTLEQAGPATLSPAEMRRAIESASRSSYTETSLAASHFAVVPSALEQKYRELPAGDSALVHYDQAPDGSLTARLSGLVDLLERGQAAYASTLQQSPPRRSRR